MFVPAESHLESEDETSSVDSYEHHGNGKEGGVEAGQEISHYSNSSSSSESTSDTDVCDALPDLDDVAAPEAGPSQAAWRAQSMREATGMYQVTYWKNTFRYCGYMRKTSLSTGWQIQCAKPGHGRCSKSLADSKVRGDSELSLKLLQWRAAEGAFSEDVPDRDAHFNIWNTNIMQAYVDGEVISDEPLDSLGSAATQVLS